MSITLSSSSKPILPVRAQQRRRSTSIKKAINRTTTRPKTTTGTPQKKNVTSRENTVSLDHPAPALSPPVSSHLQSDTGTLFLQPRPHHRGRLTRSLKNPSRLPLLSYRTVYHHSLLPSPLQPRRYCNHSSHHTRRAVHQGIEVKLSQAPPMEEPYETFPPRLTSEA